MSLRHSELQLQSLSQKKSILKVQIQYQQLQMDNQFNCPKCKESYTQSNPPKKLVRCTHTVCLKCLNEQIICPIDRIRIEKRKLGLESFITNQSILQKMQQSKQAKKKCGEKENSQKNESNINQVPKKQYSTPIPSKYPPKNSPSVSNFDEGCLFVQIPYVSSPEKNEKEKTLVISPKKVKLNFDTCLLHLKKADLICLKDRCLICASCGLFGQHKNHKIIPYEEFLVQYSKVAQQSFKIYENINQRKEKLDKNAIQQQLEQSIIEKRQRQTKKIRSHISNCIQALHKYQKQLISDLQIALSFKKNKFLNDTSLQDLITRKDQYIISLQTMSKGVDDVFNLEKISQFIDYIDKESSNGFLIHEGQYLLVQIDNFYKQKMVSLQQQVQDIAFNFNPIADNLRVLASMQSKDMQLINQALQQKRKATQKNSYLYKSNTPSRPEDNAYIALSNKQNKMSPHSKQKKQQDHLLLGTNSKSGSKEDSIKKLKQVSPKQVSPIQLSSHFNFNICTVQSNKILEEDHQINHFPPKKLLNYPNNNPQTGSSSNRLLQTSRSRQGLSSSRANLSKSRPKREQQQSLTERPNILGEKSQNKKKRRLDLPDKYMRIYEDLQRDKLQVIDLGAAFLGDSNILAISELFTSRPKLKSAKLMNNKISDQIFPELIYRSRSLTSLNLSYNFLTEKSLNWLEQQAQHLGQLTNITLSNNKIVLRNVRDRLENLARRGIKVSL